MDHHQVKLTSFVWLAVLSVKIGDRCGRQQCKHGHLHWNLYWNYRYVGVILINSVWEHSSITQQNLKTASVCTHICATHILRTSCVPQDIGWHTYKECNFICSYLREVISDQVSYCMVKNLGRLVPKTEKTYKEIASYMHELHSCRKLAFEHLAYVPQMQVKLPIRALAMPSLSQSLPNIPARTLIMLNTLACLLCWR